MNDTSNEFTVTPVFGWHGLHDPDENGKFWLNPEYYDHREVIEGATIELPSYNKLILCFQALHSSYRVAHLIYYMAMLNINRFVERVSFVGEYSHDACHSIKVGSRNRTTHKIIDMQPIFYNTLLMLQTSEQYGKTVVREPYLLEAAQDMNTMCNILESVCGYNLACATSIDIGIFDYLYQQMIQAPSFITGKI